MSDAGRRLVAINSVKHGLTAPIESTPWGAKVADLEELLKSEGLGPIETLEIAGRLVEFERNIGYQRQRFQEEVTGKARAQIIPEGAKQDFEVAAQINTFAEQKRTQLLGMDRPLARETAKFIEMTAARQVREANRDAAKELKNADRYLRRAANQLIKQLKSLGDKPNLQNEPILGVGVERKAR
jgi:hypothetical protein